MSLNDLYEFAFDAADVAVRDYEAAHRNGYINCPEAGGWLRPITEDEVRYGPGGRDAAIERMLRVEQTGWWNEELMHRLLDAAGGER